MAQGQTSEFGERTHVMGIDLGPRNTALAVSSVEHHDLDTVAHLSLWDLDPGNIPKTQYKRTLLKNLWYIVNNTVLDWDIKHIVVEKQPRKSKYKFMEKAIKSWEPVWNDTIVDVMSSSGVRRVWQFPNPTDYNDCKKYAVQICKPFLDHHNITHDKLDDLADAILYSECARRNNNKHCKNLF